MISCELNFFPSTTLLTPRLLANLIPSLPDTIAKMFAPNDFAI